MKEICIILGGKSAALHSLNLQDASVFEDVHISEILNLALKLEASGAKIIICATGAYARIVGHLNIPVIPIFTATLDLLEAIHSLGSRIPPEQKVAFVLHNASPADVTKIQPFVKNKLFVYRYKIERDIELLVQKMAADGINTVIGGATAVSLAKQFGLNAFSLYSGQETLAIAVDKGRAILSAARNSLEISVRMTTILNLFSHGIIITDNKGGITACNTSALNHLELTNEDILGKNIQQVTGDDTWITSYKSGLRSANMIKKHGKNTFFVSDYPIKLPDGHIAGSVTTLQKVEEVEKLEQQYRKIKTAGLTAKSEFKNIIGKSKIILQTINNAKAYAEVDSTILIEGETGSGKEIFAQSIHNASQRRYGPFVAINCATLPENLLESELMGYEEGAFTGARRGGKPGLLELANKGTIFLDEINQISPSIQARILRVIQEKEVMRLGGECVIPVDVRLVAATNEPLEKKVAKGEFREDLYYRLNVLNLPLPPVRERVEDIALILNFLIKQFSKTFGEIKSLSPASLTLLANYAWPGNVREMYNFVERYAVQSQNRSIAENEFVQDYINHIKPTSGSMEKNGFYQIAYDTLENMEKDLIQQSLKRFKNNKTYTAMMLGIGRSTLWKKAQK